ncbi:hypothetical protein AAG565_03220 [Fontimonas sp. SYSU GA230001]|uniref:hypothetical protein n=1 Tax=Fontimonas sp. SYSU GA230001 TaxID=3142450 RepID=UPI0032B4EB45
MRSSTPFPIPAVAARWVVLACLLGASSVHAAAMAGDAAPIRSGTLRLSEPGEAVTIAVEVLGAVGQPGRVTLSPLAATVDAVVQAAGGLLPDAYRFGTIVLRAGADAGAGVAACVSAADLQASLLLGDDAALGGRRDLVEALRSGRLHRVGQQAAVLGDEPPPPLSLQQGDVVVVPARAAAVYVLTPGARIVRLQHEAALRAEAYLRRADPEAAAHPGRQVLLFPNGREVELSLKPWRYEPTMVPPGSLIAPAVDCLPSE